MKTDRIRRAGLLALTLMGVLAVSWLLPPAVHKIRSLCPVRPDGVDQAEALPSFARKYKVSCSQCHSGFPVLNAYGRQFKMNGFVREAGSSEGVLKSQDGELTFEQYMPWALIVRSRPVDNAKSGDSGNNLRLGLTNPPGVSNTGTQMGGTKSPNPNGFQFQPLNDVDAFIAGGDAARHISYLGELDANQAGGFAPSMGDVRLGYHPLAYLNVIAARRNFFADDPYQTIVSNESPTIAGRATDLQMQGQGSISGNTLLTMQQMMGLNGQVDLIGDSFLYYAAAATKDSDGGNQWTSPTNGSARVALDSGKGMMIGAFGTYGHERPSAVGGLGGNLGVDNTIGEKQQFDRYGIDALCELGGFAARGAVVFSHDNDNLGAVDPNGGPNRPIADRNRAAYAELAYYYKRGAMYPFLVPLVRENWYSTYNGKQQFNYMTAQVAHYFAPNLKGFVEYSFDTKTGKQGDTLDPTTQNAGTTRISRGNRTSLQFEVGF